MLLYYLTNEEGIYNPINTYFLFNKFGFIMEPIDEIVFTEPSIFIWPGDIQYEIIKNDLHVIKNEIGEIQNIEKGLIGQRMIYNKQ